MELQAILIKPLKGSSTNCSKWLLLACSQQSGRSKLKTLLTKPWPCPVVIMSQKSRFFPSVQAYYTHQSSHHTTIWSIKQRLTKILNGKTCHWQTHWTLYFQNQLFQKIVTKQIHRLLCRNLVTPSRLIHHHFHQVWKTLHPNQSRESQSRWELSVSASTSPWRRTSQQTKTSSSKPHNMIPANKGVIGDRSYYR